MKWALILVWTFGGPSLAVVKVEFESERLCEAARERAEAHCTDHASTLRGRFCVSPVARGYCVQVRQ